jgi:hypothetical protein
VQLQLPVVGGLVVEVLQRWWETDRPAAEPSRAGRLEGFPIPGGSRSPAEWRRTARHSVPCLATNTGRLGFCGVRARDVELSLGSSWCHRCRYGVFQGSQHPSSGTQDGTALHFVPCLTTNMRRLCLCGVRARDVERSLRCAWRPRGRVRIGCAWPSPCATGKGQQERAALGRPSSG